MSVRTRLLMAEANLRLFPLHRCSESAVHQFYAVLAQALNPEFHSLSGYSRENAHKISFRSSPNKAWSAWPPCCGGSASSAPASGSARKRSGPLHERDALFWLLAFVGTWLGGHPLLVRKFSTVFFLYAAISCGAHAACPGQTRARGRSGRRNRWAHSAGARNGSAGSRWTWSTGDRALALAAGRRHQYRKGGSTLSSADGKDVATSCWFRWRVPETAYMEVHLGRRVIQERRITANEWRASRDRCASQREEDLSSQG